MELPINYFTLRMICKNKPKIMLKSKIINCKRFWFCKRTISNEITRSGTE